MANDTKFIDGLIVQAPRDNAPEYVKARLWIKRAELIAWLQAQTGDSINADVKVSQQGKWYCQVDKWKPEARQSAPPARQVSPQSPADDFEDSTIPF